MSTIITYKNIQLHFTSTGKGNTIVLLHGFLENSNMWKDIIPVLAQKNHVITIDLLGHGNTECLGYVHTMEDNANMVKHVLDYLNIKKAVFVGHSMGGYVALAVVNLFPKTVKGLCLLNSTFKNDNDERKNLRKRAIKMAETNYTSIVRMSFLNLFSEQSRTTYKLKINNALNEALKTTVRSYISSQKGMLIRNDFTELFKELTCKKTIILGKKDTLINAENMLLFANKHQVSTTVLSEGHMSHIENKFELITALKTFVK